MRLRLVLAVVGAAVALPLPSWAHCDNVQKLCGFAVQCWNGPDNAHLPRVREGIRNNNGQEVWGELGGCGSIDDNGGKSCSDPDYVGMATAALRALGGDRNACVALPP
jgi:hypothetical protein